MLAKPFVRKRKSGVSRIIRDNYGSTWYSTSSTVQKRDKKCLECGSIEHLHSHHIKPLSKGGTTTKANLITLCETCHSKRHRHF